MSSSSWPILLGLIALVAGAVWFDAQHGSSASAKAEAAAGDTAEMQAVVK